jgi:hypothetical protein
VMDGAVWNATLAQELYKYKLVDGARRTNAFDDIDVYNLAHYGRYRVRQAIQPWGMWEMIN